MTKHFGKNSENLVADYLEQQGFIILERNYKKFFGEIDLIAQKNDLIAFVEVKARKKNNELLYQLVDIRKQNKIGMTARSFINSLDQNFYNYTYRFDVALVIGPEDNQNIEYVTNAFVLSE